MSGEESMLKQRLHFQVRIYYKVHVDVKVHLSWVSICNGSQLDQTRLSRKYFCVICLSNFLFIILFIYSNCHDRKAHRYIFQFIMRLINILYYYYYWWNTLNVPGNFAGFQNIQASLETSAHLKLLYIVYPKDLFTYLVNCSSLPQGFFKRTYTYCTSHICTL